MDPYENPLEVVEYALKLNEYFYEYEGNYEIHFSATGLWGEHGLWFLWNPQKTLLTLSLALSMSWKENRKADVKTLILLVNQKLIYGHFDVLEEDQIIIYRCGLPLPDDRYPKVEEIDYMIMMALDSIERFVPAFNFLNWVHKSPFQAAEAAMFETIGEA